MKSKILFGDIAKFSNGKTSPERDDNAKYNVFGSNGIIGKSNLTNTEDEIVIIGRVGSYCGSVYFSKHKCWVMDNAIKCEAKKDNVPSFIYYQALKLNLNNFRVGSGQPLLNQGILNSLEINYFDPHTQKKIAHILSTLDDKIELNRKMNQTLEEMAQALFKSWFVDFDPVHVKMGCANDEELEVAARELGISKEVLELFPSKFEESELGMIPKGWSSSDLGYIFTERKEKVKDRTDVSVMSVIQTGELVNPKDVFSKQVHSADISKYKLVYPLDLGYNPSRINIGSAGFNKSKSFGAMSPVYTVMQFQDTKFHPFMELFMKQGSTKKWINTLASGSVRQSLSQNDFLSIPVVIPSDRILNKFNSIYTAFHDSISSKNQEILTLENTRDTLLPKLLSGELDVSELEMETL